MYSLMMRLGRPALNGRNPAGILSLAFTLFILFALSTPCLSQEYQDYCAAGQAVWAMGQGRDSLTFSIPSGKHATVCMEINNLSFNFSEPGCDQHATVTVAMYKGGSMIPAAPGNCPSPLSYSFEAGGGYTTGACPSGTDVQCCCLEAGKYVVRICGPEPQNGWCADYSHCFDSGNLKLCIACSDGNCP